MKFIVRPNSKEDIPFWKMHYGGDWGYLINAYSAPNGYQQDNPLVAFVGPDGGRINIVSKYSVTVEVIDD